MEAVAKARHLRSSQNRLRQVADLIRGQEVEQALSILHGLKPVKKGARMIDKVLKSAISNFQSASEGAKSKGLRVKTVLIDQGPLMKRIRPRAQGRAFRIEKKLSHITLVVSD
jgi:large subunit ribosomal protein L22